MSRPTQPAGIEYANARIRAARSRLLKPDDFEVFMSAPDLDGFIRILGSNGYGSYLEDARLTKSGITAVSYALQAAMSDAYAFVFGLFTPAYRKHLETFVGRKDVQDLKTVVRGKEAGISAAEIIDSLIGTGATIPRDDLVLLAEQDTIEDMVALALTLRMPYASALNVGLLEYQLKEAMVDFEIELDREYVKWAHERLHGGGPGADMVRELFEQETDIVNAVTAMRVVDSKRDIEDLQRYFLEGGKLIDLRTFLKLAQAPDILTLLERLPNDSYRAALDEAKSAYFVTGSIAAWERAVRVFEVKQSVRKNKRDVLGFGVALAYLIAKENEITNLRIIAHGKRYRIPDEMLRKELVFV